MRLVARLRGRAVLPPVKRAGCGLGERCRSASRAKRCLGQRDQRVVIDLAGGDQDQAAGAILVARASRAGRRRVIAAMLASSPSTERPSGWSAKAALQQIVEDDVVGRVARFAQFLQDDVLLALQLVGVEMRAQDQVGDQLDAERQMLGQDAAREAGRRRARSQALRSPPTSSIASLISRAERPPAPLNTICSNRWARPLSRAGSWREPTSA